MGFIGAALAGIGSALAGGFAAFTATMIGKIVAGAVIGGLASAVMGGDILKGALFGAVGGAVVGVVGNFGNLASSVGSVGGGPSALAAGTAGSDAASLAAAEATRAAATQTISGTVGSVGSSIIKEYGGSILKGLAGSFMKSQEFDALEQSRIEQIRAQADAEIAVIREKDRLGLYAAQKHVPQDVPYMEMERTRQQTQREQLAEQRRQFDIQNAANERQWDTLQEEKKQRQSLFKDYGTRGTPTSEDTVDSGGVFEARQEDSLAAVEGSQPLTGAETALGEFGVNEREEEVV